MEYALKTYLEFRWIIMQKYKKICSVSMAALYQWGWKLSKQKIRPL